MKRALISIMTLSMFCSCSSISRARNIEDVRVNGVYSVRGSSSCYLEVTEIRTTEDIAAMKPYPVEIVCGREYCGLNGKLYEMTCLNFEFIKEYDIDSLYYR